MVTAYPIGDCRSITTGEFRAWALIIVAVAYWANLIRPAAQTSGFTADAAMQAVLENGAFDVGAWLLIFARAWPPMNTPPIRARHIVSIVAVALIVLVPVRLASAAGLAMAGMMFFTDARLPREMRQIRLVMFALAFEIVWMSPLAAPLHMLIAAQDASVTATLLNLAGQTATHNANYVDNLSAGFGIAIWPYCTSSVPLAAIGTAFLVTVLYRDGALKRPCLRWLALSWLASILLTEVRLVILASSAEHYHWWHDGPGATIYTLAALGLAVAFPILATAGPRRSDRDVIRRAAA